MKLRACLLFSLLDFCLAAQKWKLDSGCFDYNYDAIKAAVQEAITLAETAYDVLQNNYATDGRVQQMVKYVLGDDAGLSGKIDKAKTYLEGVKNYEKIPAVSLGAPFVDNKDLLIFCTNTNYQEKDGKRTNKVLQCPMPSKAWDFMQVCYTKGVTPGVGDELPMALTTSSDGINDVDYQSAVDKWTAGGSSGPPPDRALYAVEFPELPNTIDLCTWYLESITKGGFEKVDKSTIEKIQQPEFISGLQGNDKPVDTLLQTLAGTFVHELTHTNLGGKTIDNRASGGCYGWKCIGSLHDPANADSINALAVSLSIWKMGYYVDNDGTVKSI